MAADVKQLALLALWPGDQVDRLLGRRGSAEGGEPGDLRLLLLPGPRTLEQIAACAGA